ncbi:MAG: hypothetical protein VX899_18435 [Myxococcota bacterium]|nr:hypothetical protein [Myxococcota bacterium]
MWALLLTLGSPIGLPMGLPLGEVPAELKGLPDPAGQWVGRVGVGLSPTSLHLDGQAFPRWQAVPEAGYYAPLVAELEDKTKEGRQAASDQRFVGELYVELSPDAAFSDLLIVLGSAERAGFSQARLSLEGGAAQEPRSVRVGLRPGKGAQVKLRGDMAWTVSESCSLAGVSAEPLLAIAGPVTAGEFMPWIDGEEGRLMPVEPCLAHPPAP